jgi:hypothetical protein
MVGRSNFLFYSHTRHLLTPDEMMKKLNYTSDTEHGNLISNLPFGSGAAAADGVPSDGQVRGE